MIPVGLSLEWIPAILLWCFTGTDVPLAFVEIEIQHILKVIMKQYVKVKSCPFSLATGRTTAK